MADATMYAGLEGLDKALEIQGGMRGPDLVRSDAGLYLYHEITDYLSRRQTYHVETTAFVSAAAGAGDYTVTVPATAGIRYGRYLSACDVRTSSAALLTGWVVVLGNSGLQPGFPVTNGAVILSGAGTFRTFGAGAIMLVPDFTPVRFPIWVPPGGQLILALQTSGISGSYTLRSLWSASEDLNQAGTVPAGVPRAQIKV